MEDCRKGGNIMRLDFVILKKEDIDDMQELFEAVYPDRKNYELYWDWVFDNPNGYHPIGLRKDGLLIAMHNYWLTPTAGMSTSAMMHPDYRGQGYWGLLCKFCFTEMERLGKGYIYLFANEAIHNIHAHQGFEHIKQIKEYRIPIDDIEIDVGMNYYPKIYKFDSYDDWRYKKHPFNTYIYYTNPITGGYMIFSEYKNRLQIISYNNLNKAIGVAAHIGNLLNKEIISFWSKKELDYPSIMIPTWLMIRNLNHPNFDKIKQIWKNQPLMMGDSDVY